MIDATDRQERRDHPPNHPAKEGVGSHVDRDRRTLLPDAEPMDGPDRVANTQLAVDYCRRRPRWRLSLQTHKLIGIP